MANSVSPIPRVIWMYWHEGELNAPELAQLCIRSWRERNPEWEVKVLDEKSLFSYVDPSSEVPRWRELPVVKQSNLIRLMLLEKFGGVWADATLYCANPLSEWFDSEPASGMVLVDVPESGDKYFDTFFIASVPHGKFVAGWKRLYFDFIRPVPRQMTSSTTKRILKRYPFLKPRLGRALFSLGFVRDRIGAPYFAAQYTGTRLLITQPTQLVRWLRRSVVRVGKFSRIIKRDDFGTQLKQSFAEDEFPIWKFSNRVPDELSSRMSEVTQLLRSDLAQGR